MLLLASLWLIPYILDNDSTAERNHMTYTHVVYYSIIIIPVVEEGNNGIDTDLCVVMEVVC